MKAKMFFIFFVISLTLSAQQTLFNVGQYHSGCAQITNGVKIKTNIPFTPSYFPSVIIEGYAYGASNTLALQISWYVWENKFYPSSVVSSFGSHTPKITLGKENYNGGDYVVIFVEDQTYCLNFSVRSNYTTASTNWTIVDEPLYASTKMDLSYKNSFKGNVNFTNGIWSSDGNVGIGTTNPLFPLDIRGIEKIQRFSINENNYLYTGIDRGGFYFEQVSDIHEKNKIRLQARNINTGIYSQLFINGQNNSFNFIEGNVGIGTTNPQAKLEIFDSNVSPAIISLQSNRNDYGYVDVGKIKATQAQQEIASINFKRANGTYTGYITFGVKETNESPVKDVMVLSQSGNMSLQGKLEAKEVKVVQVPTADFVFENEYKLPTLEEVEKHIKEKKHLPEIASAKQMEKEGLNVGEFQIKLLQKIEELTLYIIDLKKENNQIKSEIKKLKEQK